MHRKSLDKNKGMLFSWKYEKKISMWMKNTYIPLDIIWLNQQKKVVHIHNNATILSTIPIHSPVSANYIIELNAGTAKTASINIQSQFSFKSTSEQQ